MGILDSVFGETTHGTLASKLLGLLSNNKQPDDQSPGAVSGGLNELVQRFQEGGYGDVIKSWLGSGENRSIGEDDVHQALGSDTIDQLSEHTGMERGQLLPLLAKFLPNIVDRLTPNERVPDESEVSDLDSDPGIYSGRSSRDDRTIET